MTFDTPAHTTRTPHPHRTRTHQEDWPMGAQMGIESGQVGSRLHFQLFWGPFRSFPQPERPLEAFR